MRLMHPRQVIGNRQPEQTQGTTQEAGSPKNTSVETSKLRPEVAEWLGSAETKIGMWKALSSFSKEEARGWHTTARWTEKARESEAVRDFVFHPNIR